MKRYNKPTLEPAQGNCLEQLIGEVPIQQLPNIGQASSVHQLDQQCSKTLWL